MPATPPCAHEPTAPAPKPRRRWPLRLLLFLAAIAGLAALLWPHPEMASERFMEGGYRPAIVPGGFHDEGFLSLEFHDGRYMSFYDGGDFMDQYDSSYRLDGATVHLAGNSNHPEHLWHYRTFDGVALLIPDAQLTTLLRDGGSLADRQNDFHFWSKVMIRSDPRYRAALPRLLREHPRFTAILPPSVRAQAEIPWTQYLRFRWRDFLIDHPTLRKRLPASLHGD